MSGISTVYETFRRTAEKVEVADFEELTVLLKRFLDPDTDFGSRLVNSELPADSTRKRTKHHLGEGCCPKHDSDGSNRKTGPWR
jgi:hypothetical protein